MTHMGDGIHVDEDTHIHDLTKGITAFDRHPYSKYTSVSSYGQEDFQIIVI